MNFLKSLKWCHWVIAGVGVVTIVYAWKKMRKPKLSVDTITSEIKIGPNLKSVA